MTLSLRPWTLTLLLSLLSESFIAQTHTHNGVTPCGLNHAEEMLFLRRPETRNAAIEATRALELETQQGVTAAQRVFIGSSERLRTHFESVIKALSFTFEVVEFLNHIGC